MRVSAGTSQRINSKLSPCTYIHTYIHTYSYIPCRRLKCNCMNAYLVGGDIRSYIRWSCKQSVIHLLFASFYGTASDGRAHQINDIAWLADWLTGWLFFIFLVLLLLVFMKSDIHKTCLDVYFLCNWYFVWLFECFLLLLFCCLLVLIGLSVCPRLPRFSSRPKCSILPGNFNVKQLKFCCYVFCLNTIKIYTFQEEHTDS